VIMIIFKVFLLIAIIGLGVALLSLLASYLLMGLIKIELIEFKRIAESDRFTPETSDERFLYEVWGMESVSEGIRDKAKNELLRRYYDDFNIHNDFLSEVVDTLVYLTEDDYERLSEGAVVIGTHPHPKPNTTRYKINDVECIVSYFDYGLVLQKRAIGFN
jgi:hypothetical protein